MPDVGTTTDEVDILRWLVEVGDTVARGEPLVEVETDKAVVEVESIVSGTITEISAEAGATVSQGQTVAIVRPHDREDDAGRPAASDKPLPAVHREPTEPPAAAAAAAGSRAGARKGFLARNKGKGAAPASGAGAVGSAPEPIALSRTQRTVGRRMQESKQAAPHFYISMNAGCEAMIACRKISDNTIAWDAMFARAVARGLREYPRLACRIDGDKLVPMGTPAIGIAADVDDELYVIAVDDPTDRPLAQVSSEIRVAAKRLADGDAEARKLRPVAMTLSNLGGSGVDTFVGVISPPQAALLAIGAVRPTACVVRGEVAVRSLVTLTLSVDHRVANGRYAAAFLQRVVEEVEAMDKQGPTIL